MISHRRELTLAVTTCLLGAALALLAAGRPWLHVVLRRSAASGFVVVTRDLSGGKLVPVVTAWSLLALAGVVAIAATRRLGRTLTGALVFAAGATIAGLSWRVRSDPLTYVTDAGARVTSTAWPWVAMVAGVVLAATGAFVGVRGRRWAALSSRYTRAPAEPKEDDLWEEA